MKDKQLLSLLEDALSAERDGHQFYTMAAEQTADPGARGSFARLAEEERRHFEVLRKEYRSILEGRRVDSAADLGERWIPERAGAIFSDEFRQRIRGKHLEMSALSIGILLEKNAYEFYATQAERAEDESVRRLFRELAEWENGHYQLLLREDEALRETYWNQNRFTPLF
jgi:rubrerythrin